MEYNKDYTTKTADEWFSLKKWSGFLMTIPLGRTVSKTCESARDILNIRATAGYLASKERDCGRRFIVSTDQDNELVMYVTALKKTDA